MKFSIIVPHYDGVISDKVLCEGMDRLSQSKFKDFEVLLYHDGPVSKPLPKFSGYNLDIKVRETKKRYNDWGHSLRDLGIKEAKGEYIIHLNPDNILYTDTLQEIAKIDSDIIICPIILEGTVRKKIGLIRTGDKKDQVILDAYPARHRNIDAMQLVMKTSLWRKYGGWFDKSEESDGLMYQKFCSENDFTYCGHLIGVHR